MLTYIRLFVVLNEFSELEVSSDNGHLQREETIRDHHRPSETNRDHQRPSESQREFLQREETIREQKRTKFTSVTPYKKLLAGFFLRFPDNYSCTGLCFFSTGQ